MQLVQRLALASLIVWVAACGGDDHHAPPPATATATLAPRTATASSAPTLTATSQPAATSTAPSLPTATVTLLPSATATPVATSTATVAVGAIALFSADGLDGENPFPTDRLLDDTGHVHVTGARLAIGVPPEAKFDMLRSYLDVVAASANQLEGFSTFAPIRILLDAPVQTGPVPDGAVYVVQAEPPFAVQAVNATGIAAGTAGAEVIEIQPVVPLAAKTRCVYVVTTEARDADGNRVRPDPDLSAALAGEAPALSGWKDSIQPALDHLRDEFGVTTDRIAIVDTFTTQPTTDDLAAIVDQFTSGKLQPAEPVFENSPIQGLVTGIFPEGSEQFAKYVGSPTSTAIAAVAVGSFASYDFRYGPQRGFDPAKVSGDVTPTTNDVDFYMSIPKGERPAAGYPLTVYGHGLTLSGDTAIGAAQILGPDAGIVIGISALEHGRRGNPLQFFNFNDAFATREHFRQTVADTLQLVRMIRSTSVPPFDQVDKETLRYYGISLGGIMGSIFMGHDPDVQVGMLSVPGGGLSAIIRSDLIGTLLQPLLAQATGIAQSDPFFPILLHNFIITAQWLLDAGDPINVAPFVIDPNHRLPGVPAKRILVHEGVHDSVVPNVTTDNLALAMGLPDLKATLGCNDPEGCNGIWRFVMSEYGQDPNGGHLVTFSVKQAAEQAQRYLESGGTQVTDASP